MTSRDIVVWGEPFDRSGIVQKLARQLSPFGEDWPAADKFTLLDAPDPADQWVANLFPPMAALLEAHRAFLRTLFEAPALQRGFSRWGVKETRLDTEHAAYLQLLFPSARFLFLVRNPFDAYESYRTWGDWFDEWPSVVATPREFGRMWARLAGDFLAHYREVGGLPQPPFSSPRVSRPVAGTRVSALRRRPRTSRSLAQADSSRARGTRMLGSSASRLASTSASRPSSPLTSVPWPNPRSRTRRTGRSRAPGSKEARFFLEGGAGRTKAQIELYFVDVRTDRVVMVPADRRVDQRFTLESNRTSATYAVASVTIVLRRRWLDVLEPAA